VSVHFTWVDDAAAVLPVLAAVEERLAQFDARPHWGKLFDLDPATLRGRYPRLPDFTRLMRERDPDGKFRNDFIDRYVSVS